MPSRSSASSPRTPIHATPVTLVNSVNPYRLDGQKTAAFEVIEDLGGAPDYLADPGRQRRQHHAPTGWASPSTATAGLVETLPAMLGIQAEGAAPLVLGQPVDDPQTVATAIRIGRPASGDAALRARDESGGRIDAVERRGDPRRVP